MIGPSMVPSSEAVPPFLRCVAACQIGPAEGPGGADEAPLRRNPDEIARMRDYLATLYAPGAVRETFVDDVGDAIDCVAFRAQPALRLQGIDPDRGRIGFTIRDGTKCCAEGTGRDCCAPDESFFARAAYAGVSNHCTGAGKDFGAKSPCPLSRTATSRRMVPAPSAVEARERSA